jgi:short-subunit dehydrogenase
MFLHPVYTGMQTLLSTNEVGEGLVRTLSADRAQLILSSRNERQLEEVRSSLANHSYAK